MSTYWYLECEAHDPPIQSGDEVEQHTYGLPAIKELIASKPDWRALLEDPERFEEDDLTYFGRNTARFMVHHPNCPLHLVSEYGEVESLRALGEVH